MIISTPRALFAPAPKPGTAIATAPPNPTARPMTMFRDGAFLATRAATPAAIRGVDPFNIPVSADDTDCSAYGNMLMGNASHKTPNQAMPARSLFCTGRRAPGTRDRVRKPITNREKVIPSGASASRPCAMNRKEVPQMRPGNASNAQSNRPDEGVVASAALVAFAGEAVIVSGR